MADTMISAGGGLSKTKLALANAAESDVLYGKRFYAKDKIIKEGKMPNQGSWGASLSPGGVVTIPAGHHNGSGQVTAVSLKTVTITMATVGGPWSYTFTGGTLVGISDIARSGDSSEIGLLHISGNTITMEWSGNGIVNRQITLIYY